MCGVRAAPHGTATHPEGGGEGGGGPPPRWGGHATTHGCEHISRGVLRDAVGLGRQRAPPLIVLTDGRHHRAQRRSHARHPAGHPPVRPRHPWYIRVMCALGSGCGVQRMPCRTCGCPLRMLRARATHISTAIPRARMRTIVPRHLLLRGIASQFLLVRLRVWSEWDLRLSPLLVPTGDAWA